MLHEAKSALLSENKTCIHRWRIVKRAVGVEQPGTVGSSRLFRGAKIFERFLRCNVQVLIIAIDRIINPEHRYFFQENVFILKKIQILWGIPDLLGKLVLL